MARRDLHQHTMRATDDSERNEETLYHSSDDRSFLFLTSNDLLTSIRSYSNMKSICGKNIAVSNAAALIIWLINLSMSYLIAFIERENSKD